MSISKKIISLGVGIASGAYTTEYISNELGDTAGASLVSLVGGVGSGMLVDEVTEKVLNTSIGNDICCVLDNVLDVGDELTGGLVSGTVDTVEDVVNVLNPFKW